MNIYFVNDPIYVNGSKLAPSIYIPGRNGCGRFVSEGGHRFYWSDAPQRGNGSLSIETAVRHDEIDKFCSSPDGYLATNPRPVCLDHPKWGMKDEDTAWRRTPEAYDVFGYVAKKIRSVTGMDVWQYGTWNEVGGAMSYSANIDAPLRGTVMTRRMRPADYVYVRCVGQEGGWTMDDVAEALHQCRVFGVPNVVMWHDPSVWNEELCAQTFGVLCAYAGQPAMPYVEGGA